MITTGTEIYASEIRLPKDAVLDAEYLFEIDQGPPIQCHSAVESDAPPVFFAFTVVEPRNVRNNDDAIIRPAAGQKCPVDI